MNKEIYIKDILKCTNGKLITGDKNDICQNFSKDTRNISKDDIYVGIKGEKFDGNEFWKEALKKGAKTVIVENIEFSNEDIKKYKNKNIVLVENTLEALHKIAKYKRNLYNIPVIAITGSVGKTSTKDIIANVVSQEYKTLKTEGNNNNNIGLPLTILKLKDHEALVIEMGMNHFGEISLLTNIAKPTISVITNIGTSHIGNLGSRENILKSKLEILEGMENKTLVINNDNDLLNSWNNLKQDENIKTYTYGIENNSDIMAKDINIKDDGSSFICIYGKEKLTIDVPVSGKHFVYNAMCATLVGKILKIDDKNIQKGIKEFELTKKRMDVIKLQNNITIINDAYNASYESMKASIEYLSKIKGKRKIAVLGDMFELGEYSEKLHKQVGEEIIKNNIDVLICTGNNSKYIINTVLQLGMNKNNVYYMNNIKEITEKLEQILEQGDCALVKASNAMRFFDIVEQIQKN